MKTKTKNVGKDNDYSVDVDEVKAPSSIGHKWTTSSKHSMRIFDAISRMLGQKKKLPREAKTNEVFRFLVERLAHSIASGRAEIVWLDAPIGWEEWKNLSDDEWTDVCSSIK